jgi:diaminohydroxyphosphoribosylaminopyrimidine deaminase/5-amino-6-(5-phosphoribosylamino)uracil reductase
VRVFRVAEADGRLDLAAVLTTLDAEGITRLMVEGGPMVAASFVSAGLVDEVALLRGRAGIGASGIDALEGLPLDKLTEGLTKLGSETLGVDTLETYGRD